MKNKVPDSACGLPDIKNLKYEYLGIFDTVRMGTQRLLNVCPFLTINKYNPLSTFKMANLNCCML